MVVVILQATPTHRNRLLQIKTATYAPPVPVPGCPPAGGNGIPICRTRVEVLGGQTAGRELIRREGVGILTDTGILTRVVEVSTDRHDPKGNPITPDQAHPGMLDRMRSIVPGPIARWGTVEVVVYFIIDEGSRLYPPRNLVPVP
jgi:hypothetical protein